MAGGIMGQPRGAPGSLCGKCERPHDRLALAGATERVDEVGSNRWLCQKLELTKPGDSDCVPYASIPVTFSAPVLVDSHANFGRTHLECCELCDTSCNVQFYNGATLVSDQPNQGIRVGSSMTGSPIPEPTAFAAGRLALGALGLRRRRGLGLGGGGTCRPAAAA